MSSRLLARRCAELCDKDVLAALRSALRVSAAEVHALVTAENYQYIRVMADDQVVTLNLKNGRRMKNSRGLTRHDQAIKSWLLEHRAVLDGLFEAAELRGKAIRNTLA